MYDVFREFRILLELFGAVLAERMESEAIAVVFGAFVFGDDFVSAMADVDIILRVFHGASTNLAWIFRLAHFGSPVIFLGADLVDVDHDSFLGMVFKTAENSSRNVFQRKCLQSHPGT